MVAVSQSSKGQNGRVIDNVCAAICRMIVARSDVIPLQQVSEHYFMCSSDMNEHIRVDHKFL